MNPSSIDLSTNSLWAMILAGIFNAVGFYSLGRVLQCLPGIHTNLLTASQVMLCDLGGILLFGEPAGALQIVGIALTLAGLITMHRPEKKEAKGHW